MNQDNDKGNDWGKYRSGVIFTLALFGLLLIFLDTKVVLLAFVVNYLISRVYITQRINKIETKKSPQVYGFLVSFTILIIQFVIGILIKFLILGSEPKKIHDPVYIPSKDDSIALAIEAIKNTIDSKNKSRIEISSNFFLDSAILDEGNRVLNYYYTLASVEKNAINLEAFQKTLKSEIDSIISDPTSYNRQLEQIGFRIRYIYRDKNNNLLLKYP